MAKGSSRTAVIAALVGNVLIAITKGIAFAVSGSSAMLSEAIHSVVDSGNEVLLLYGQHRARKPPDRLHPWGYGRELYFWSFVVALLIFTVGACVTVFEGVQHIRNPEPIAKPGLNFAVYAFSAVFEGIGWWFGWSAFKRVRGDRSILDAVEASKQRRTHWTGHRSDRDRAQRRLPRAVDRRRGVHPHRPGAGSNRRLAGA